MVVYFLRHAEAEPDAGSDFARKLTPMGLEQAEKMGKFLFRHGLIPDVILWSPVTRAMETARLVGERLRDSALVKAPWAACGMSPRVFLEKMEDYRGSEIVMLVGHEPDFSETIATLIGVANVESLNIRKASLTAVDVPVLAPGMGRLEFLVPVRLT